MERPTIAKLMGEQPPKQVKDQKGQATGPGNKNIQGNSRTTAEKEAAAKELKLGAYWEHNKQGVARGGIPTENTDLKPINIRIVGIPNIERMAIGPTWTIEEVRFILARDSGLKHDDIDLYFGGEKLVIDLIASNCGLLEESIITAVLRSRN
jgi:hypothetical protein